MLTSTLKAALLKATAEVDQTAGQVIQNPAVTGDEAGTEAQPAQALGIEEMKAQVIASISASQAACA